MKCSPQKIEVKRYHNCSSNFLSHLKRKHGEDCVEEYKNYIKKKKNWEEKRWRWLVEVVSLGALVFKEEFRESKLWREVEVAKLEEGGHEQCG